MNALTRSLPPFVANARLIGDLLRAIGPELEQIDAYAAGKTLETCARTAVNDLDRWESEFGLPRRGDQQADTRRALLAACFGMFENMTYAKLKAIFDMLTQGAQTEGCENIPARQVTFHARTEGYVPSDLPQVGRAVRRACPAHIECAVSAHAEMAGEQWAPILHGAAHLTVHSV